MWYIVLGTLLLLALGLAVYLTGAVMALREQLSLSREDVADQWHKRQVETIEHEQAIILSQQEIDGLRKDLGDAHVSLTLVLDQEEHNAA